MSKNYYFVHSKRFNAVSEVLIYLLTHTPTLVHPYGVWFLVSCCSFSASVNIVNNSTFEVKPEPYLNPFNPIIYTYIMLIFYFNSELYAKFKDL